MALLCAATDDLTGLRTADLTEEAPFALLPRDHPPARRSVVTVAEPGQDADFDPECPPAGLDEIVDRVALGRLVTVVGSGTCRAPSVICGSPAGSTTMLVLVSLSATAVANVGSTWGVPSASVNSGRGVAGSAMVSLPLGREGGGRLR
ncbi:hypothetical protein ACFWOB_04265 [Streptomyces sp. NPDC058420]|uniref:hypothetical protein n=1 Tax=Streptomyces sp. NPDC058420 TaxID=3346489 RepID=UPI0036563ACF